MLSASIGTAADLDVEPGDIANQVLPIVQLFRQQPPQTARLRHGELARFRARTTRDIGEGAGTRSSKSCGQQTAIQLGYLSAPDPADDQILVVGHSNAAVTERTGELANKTQLRRGQVPQQSRNDDGGPSFESLRLDVRRRPPAELAGVNGQPWLHARHDAWSADQR
jgi:hypothetical protein